MFVEGRFRLRCIATQYTLYRKAADVWLQEDMPQLAHVLGPSNPNPGKIGIYECSRLYCQLRDNQQSCLHRVTCSGIPSVPFPKQRSETLELWKILLREGLGAAEADWRAARF